MILISLDEDLYRGRLPSVKRSNCQVLIHVCTINNVMFFTNVIRKTCHKPADTYHIIRNMDVYV